MKPTDLELLTSVSKPTIHPDGKWAVFATSTPNLDADAYVGQLWRVDLDGSSLPRRITRGFRDAAPRFSVDGNRIAFLRSDGENPPQVFVVASDGGEPVAATAEKLGVSTFEWSPDGKQLAYTARVPEHGRYGSVKDLGAGAEPPRRIITRRYLSNGLGFIRDRRNHIFLVEAPDIASEPTYRRAPSADEPIPEAFPGVPETRQVTDGDFDDGYIRFSPDGSRIAFVSARHAERDIDLANNIYELDLNTPDAEPVARLGTGGRYGIDGIAYASDGTLWFVGTDLGPDGNDFVGRGGALYRVASDGSASRLTDPANVDLSEGANEFMALPDSSVLVLHRKQGSVELVSVSSGGELTPLVQGPTVVQGYDWASGTVVVSYSDANTKGEIGVVRNGVISTLTDFSRELVASGITPISELTINGRDGTPVHGWVLLPKGDGPHPVLLNIHGGPFTQYTGSFFDEAQVYVDAGYAVVMCNPRGAAGYGEKFGRAIIEQMGTLDFTDVLDFLDGAIAANPSMDGSRLGIMGGSYGGYLTAWTISQDHRFAAAIVERGYLDPELMIGTSDIGDFFGDRYTGVDPEQIRRQSPQAFVHQVTTPTLVLHSENDLRCPLSQGTQYYSALIRQGVHAEMLIFPGEDHELSRSGRPRHRQQRFEAVLDWWSRNLPISPI